MSENYISIEDFASISGVKVNTVKKRWKEIPGIKYENGKFLVQEGTRYPFNMRHCNLKDSDTRRYILLLAISEYKYIDAKKLEVYPKQFHKLLKELYEAGLIEENHLGNNQGANTYDCTAKGDQVLKLKKTEAIEEITKLASEFAGKLIGTVISELK